MKPQLQDRLVPRPQASRPADLLRRQAQPQSAQLHAICLEPSESANTVRTTLNIRRGCA